jgi:DNA helicase-2/ATP-dependent DNA helicase PcrA
MSMLKSVYAFENGISDDLYWKRFLTLFPKIGEKTYKKVKDELLKGKIENPKLNSTWELIMSQPTISGKIMEFTNSFYMEKLENMTNPRSRLRGIMELASFASQYNDLGKFLEEIAIDSTIKEEKKGLVLSTIHQAKGMEWERVFIVDLIEGVFPDLRADYEEERRLFYVAASRAKSELYLLYPLKRWGWKGEDLVEASTFIYDAME